jgi:hypothetical protein
MLARGLDGAKHFRGTNPVSGTSISYFLRSPAPTGSGRNAVRITISDMRGTVVRELTGTNDAGINRVQWNLAPTAGFGAGRGGGFGAGRGRGTGPQFINPQAVEPGAYLVKLSAGSRELTKTVLVEADNLR